MLSILLVTTTTYPTITLFHLSAHQYSSKRPAIHESTARDKKLKIKIGFSLEILPEKLAPSFQNSHLLNILICELLFSSDLEGWWQVDGMTSSHSLSF